jgi:hypothetical protein
MATKTFDKKIVVKSDEAMDTLLKGLGEPNVRPKKKRDVVAELNRSREILHRSYYRSKM